MTLEEVHHDEIEITDHPVEFGATISDHAFRRPSEIRISCGWSNSPSNTSLGNVILAAGSALSGAVAGAAAAIGAGVVNILTGSAGQDVIVDMYDKIYKLQQGLIPFDVVTGKRKYSNMLMKSLMVHTDQKSENILAVTMECREVIIARTQTVTVPNAAVMAAPQKNAPVQNAGTKSLVQAPQSKTYSGATGTWSNGASGTW